MSDHSGDTEVIPLDWEHLCSGLTNGDFARLVPWNDEARLSFNHVVQLLDGNPGLLPRTRSMMY